MKKDWVLTQDAFDQLLEWLGPDREHAALRYEEIRRRLIKIFVCRGCRVAEELTDETIDRVTSKLVDVARGYEGDPALYFFGVAHKVHLEYVRKRPTPDLPPVPDAVDESEPEYECLERCMGQLPDRNRELVLEYYKEERQAKIDHRKEMADRLGITTSNLRLRAHRIRAALQECVTACVSQGQPA